MQTCLSITVLFGKALRLHAVAPPRIVTENLPYRGPKGQLHLLIDNTCVKVASGAEFHASKPTGLKRLVWRRVYLMIDQETPKIRIIEIDREPYR
ncbi:hypothetical protein [Paracoccus sp. Ld10]|uniref:hypothetical protein n=1 Tax=Paracoccus sp. Ld10 TaxID=649158 RepID=UPI003867F669